MSAAAKRVRCAIYTRKSSEEGLEQDFNSLDAQREACAAYVASQASEGWRLLPAYYDDGGLSGGTLERPALQRLLGDVAAGQVDIIVVYKVDRLTRSLLDFAQLVEALDKAGTSFVSVTQSFNTTTSMGRLTLNMLLSFAQFEREVTAERIRDKIAASKAKGMWMGGTPPLGYRPDGRSLAIVEEHAAIVREIFRRYLELGNVRRLAEQLAGEGIRVPRRQRQSGAAFGDVAFTRGQLYALLKNAIYTGMIVHKGTVYPGKHLPIIAQEQWDAVQRLLAAHVQGQRRRRTANQSLLVGKIIDGAGEPLIATHANKQVANKAEAGKLRYRYYVSKAAHYDAAPGGLRIPAREIEGLVTGRIAALFEDPLALIDRARLEVSPAHLPGVIQRGAELALTLKGSRVHEIAALVQQVRVAAGHIEIDVHTGKLAELLGTAPLAQSPPPLTLSEPIHLTRTGRVVRLVDGRGKPAVSAAPDPSLTTMLITARRWWAQLAQGQIKVQTLAIQEDVTASWITRVVRLAFLAPPVVEAVLSDQLRAEALSSALLQPGAVPACWQEQQARYLPATT